MAKKATGKAKGERRSGDRRKGDRRSGGKARRSSQAGDAFVALLQSPLVADLVAVAATAALAALAQEGFGKSGAPAGERAGKAVKRAGKAAADAVGRRLTEEIAEIKQAAKAAKAGAKR
ncbi:MAG TPA: hypothetical protein VE989_06705 [Sphingomicrobium sp.]|nr:hypothetical protein [Sphingomicrobium sp.]